MLSIEAFGTDTINDRSLFVLELDSPETLDTFSLPSKHFACLIAWDTDSILDESILRILRSLVESGAAYICCWGNDCERVHDLADQVNYETNSNSDNIIMTTWHSDESLPEAIWFLFNTTWLDTYAEETLGSTIAISIGNTDYAEVMRDAFRDPRAFSEDVLDNEDSA